MSKLNPLAEQIDGSIGITCEHCGKYQQMKRASAMFCDARCKNAYHNAQRKRNKDIQLALLSLETLISNMPLRGDSPEWETLSQMQEMIKAAMWKVEEK